MRRVVYHTFVFSAHKRLRERGVVQGAKYIYMGARVYMLYPVAPTTHTGDVMESSVCAENPGTEMRVAGRSEKSRNCHGSCRAVIRLGE